MAEITPEVTRKVAGLARLDLTDAEVEAYTQQIRKVVDHVAAINSLDTSKVEPLYHPIEMELALREDEVRPFKSEKILESSAEVLYDGFKVPSIL